MLKLIGQSYRETRRRRTTSRCARLAKNTVARLPLFTLNAKPVEGSDHTSLIFAVQTSRRRRAE